MILKSTVLTYRAGSCRPVYLTRSNPYGKSLGALPRATNKGKHWTWSTPMPHDTLTAHYGTLSPTIKAGWQAAAAVMQNDHSAHSVTWYTGTVAYLQINMVRKANGESPSDTAPSLATTPTTSGTLVFINGAGDDNVRLQYGV